MLMRHLTGLSEFFEIEAMASYNGMKWELQGLERGVEPGNGNPDVSLLHVAAFAPEGDEKNGGLIVEEAFH